MVKIQLINVTYTVLIVLSFAAKIGEIDLLNEGLKFYPNVTQEKDVEIALKAVHALHKNLQKARHWY